VGEFFTSFDDAWSHFLRRTGPLEDFFAQFPEEDDAELEGWVVEPVPAIKAAAAELQRELARFDWLVPVPAHFLHVWLALSERIGDGSRRWEEVERFPVTYARVNCFHTAVVVEVAELRRLVVGTPNDVPQFLPHMTLAVVRGSPAPGALRDVLVPLRDAVCGEQMVAEVTRVRFPAARTTVFRPWTVEQVVPLG
jgi:2'-5' RNA ligase